jgi:hypothetical protein
VKTLTARLVLAAGLCVGSAAQANKDVNDDVPRPTGNDLYEACKFRKAILPIGKGMLIVRAM